MFPRRAHPLWTTRFDGAPAIARLGFLEGWSRAVVSATVPLDAFDALGSARSVSVTYAVGAALATVITLNAANMERFVLRRWVTTLGLGANLAGSVVFMLVDGPLFLVGITCLSAAASLFSTTLALYIMEHIPRTELTRAESGRVVWVGVAWFTGPLLGVLLRQYVAGAAPYMFSFALAAFALGYFWVLRLGANPVLVQPRTMPANPLVSIRRYFKQRYLRIAYAITLVRAMFWVSIFLYGSVYVIDAGLPAWASGAFLSGVATLLLLARPVATIAEHRGTRVVVALSFGLIAVGLVFVAAIGSPKPIGLVGWGVAAVGASALDVVGNIPFMRTVKPRDRIAMTGVFSTWRDISALAAPALAALVLTVAPLRAFHLLLAALAVATAWVAQLLPRRV